MPKITKKYRFTSENTKEYAKITLIDFEYWEMIPVRKIGVYLFPPCQKNQTKTKILYSRTRNRQKCTSINFE